MEPTKSLDEICIDLIAKIRDSDSWQAKAWLLERSNPMEFALDSSIRQAILNWAQESGLDVADLNDLIRVLKECVEHDIDLGAFVSDEIKRRESQAQVL